MECCNDGIVAPAPPCSPYCEEFCTCCYSWGSFGFDSLAKQETRGQIFLVLSFSSILQIAIALVAACSLAKNEQTVMDTNWMTMEDSNGATLYIGLTSVVHEFPGQPRDVGSFDEFCDFLNSTATNSQIGSDCYDCDEQADALYMTAITTVFSKLGQLTTDATRSTQQEDVVCQRIFGIITGLLGTVTGLSAFGSWSAACYDAIPTTFVGPAGTTLTMDKSYGPGFICIWIATALAIPDIIAHLLVPVPPEHCEVGWRENEDAGDPASIQAP